MGARDWVLSIDEQVQRMNDVQASRELQLAINSLEKLQIGIYDRLAENYSDDELADLGVYRYDDNPPIVWINSEGDLVRSS